MAATLDLMTSHRISVQHTVGVIRWRTGLDLSLAFIRMQWRMELANWRGGELLNMRDVWTIADIEGVVAEWQWLEFMEVN